MSMLRTALEEHERLKERISELEEGLKHIRDYRYSAEMCREIASATLDGRGDYQEQSR